MGLWITWRTWRVTRSLQGDQPVNLSLAKLLIKGCIEMRGLDMGHRGLLLDLIRVEIFVLIGGGGSASLTWLHRRPQTARGMDQQ
jgi:hypothetical protein